MPYKCVHCSELYVDGSSQVLTGCGKCGRKFFFYIKKEKLKEIEINKEQEIEFDSEEKEKIEQDVRDIAGVKNEESPVFLDFESVKVVKQGKYLLDLQKLFSAQPQIYQLEDGKYIVDLTSALKQQENKN